MVTPAMPEQSETLLTWVGSRDPKWFNPRNGQEQFGPILSLLKTRPVKNAWLFFTLDNEVDNFAERARQVLRICQKAFPHITVKHRPVSIASVTDYREIYRTMRAECATLLKEEQRANPNYVVYLSPGTPQMQTVWMLLVLSGQLPAKMIQVTPYDLAQKGEPLCQDVDLSIPDFPTVSLPGADALSRVAMETQIANLNAEIKRLRSLVEARTESPTGPVGTTPGVIGDQFSLAEAMKAYERSCYADALIKANGNAAAAARLLGVEPGSFRARAATLGVRPRRPLEPMAD